MNVPFDSMPTGVARIPGPARRRMRPLFAVVLLGFLAFTIVAHADEPFPAPANFRHDREVVRGNGFLVVADRRVFAVTAFLNATGYDEEAEGAEMHPVRRRVREALDKRLAKMPEKRKQWTDWSEKQGLPLFVYLDYALSLEPDYPFRRIRPDEELGYPAVAERLDELPPILNDFWKAVGLDEIWASIQPDYRAELEAYDFESMADQMASLWTYLRMKRDDTYTIVNVPALLAQHFLGIGARYEDYYYTVESPGAGSHSLNLHEYLHSIVNPVVEAAYPAHAELLRSYWEAGREQPWLKSYQEPRTFSSECLVRALDYRVRYLRADDDKGRTRVEQRIGELTAGGFTLVAPLYDLLGQFETGERRFDQAVDGMFAALPDPTTAAEKDETVEPSESDRP